MDVKAAYKMESSASGFMLAPVGRTAFFWLCGLNHGFRLHLYHSRRDDIRLIAFAGPLLYSCYRCSAFASRCSRATGADTQSGSGWTRTRQVAN